MSNPKHPCPKCPKHPWTSSLAAFSTNVNHALSYTRQHSRSLLHWFLDFTLNWKVIQFSELSLLLSFHRIHDPPPISYHLLDLQSHCLFHLQSSPLSANILGLLYPKNKTKQTKTFLQPCYLLQSHPFFSFLSPIRSHVLCLSLHQWSGSPEGIDALLPSHLCLVFTNLSLQHWVASATCSCFGHPASLALPYLVFFLSFLTIISLLPSLALFISPSSHR